MTIGVEHKMSVIKVYYKTNGSFI